MTKNSNPKSKLQSEPELRWRDDFFRNNPNLVVPAYLAHHELRSTIELLIFSSFMWGYYKGGKDAGKSYMEALLIFVRDNRELSVYYEDIKRALDRQHSMWNEERTKVWELEQKLRKLTVQEHKKRILRNAPSEERERFSNIVKKAKRTSDGRIVFADVERRCRNEFPRGITGRNIDDKYAKELCKLWEIS